MGMIVIKVFQCISESEHIYFSAPTVQSMMIVIAEYIVHFNTIRYSLYLRVSI